MNEAYARPPTLAAPSLARLNTAATVFHASAYLTVLRWTPELAGLDPRWTWVGLAAGTFLFWSYLHITLSFALSDAQPFWAVRVFRGVTSPPVTLFHTGRPAAS